MKICHEFYVQYSKIITQIHIFANDGVKDAYI